MKKNEMNSRKFFMVILLMAIFASSSFQPMVFGESKQASIELNSKAGTVSISYDGEIGVKHMIYITKDENKISYPFFANGSPEVFPLQFGNGDYSVSIMKNTSGTKYMFLKTEKLKLNLEDSKIVYLASIQNVKWKRSDEPIKYAAKTTKGIKEAKVALEIFHKYIVSNIEYDYEKIPKLKSDYVPSISTTFLDNKGICYDYSALLASFMRSRGFPARLVKGYCNHVDGYHAWNEIYVDGKWIVIDSTVDAGSGSLEFKIKSNQNYKKVFDY